MAGADWAAWLAVTMIVQSALRTRLRRFRHAARFHFSATAVSTATRAWRSASAPGIISCARPTCLAAPYEVVASAPIEGLFASHQRTRYARRRLSGIALSFEQVDRNHHAPRLHPPRCGPVRCANGVIRAAKRGRLAFGAGAAADLARGIRRRLLQRFQRLDQPAFTRPTSPIRSISCPAFSASS